jgi:hypothetical protein
VIAKLPEMDDKALAVLRSNAERLGRTGTKSQKTQAAALLPAIEAEVDARKSAKLSRQKEARAAAAPRGRAKSKAATSAVEIAD